MSRSIALIILNKRRILTINKYFQKLAKLNQIIINSGNDTLSIDDGEYQPLNQIFEYENYSAPSKMKSLTRGYLKRM